VAATSLSQPGISDEARSFYAGCCSHPLDVEDIFTAEPYVSNLKTLRDKLEQDRQLPASLDRNSEVYRGFKPASRKRPLGTPPACRGEP
jgi:hypothetical protein